MLSQFHRHAFADGAFKVSPVIFFQLFSILGAVTQKGVNGKEQTVAMPLVHALLENKRQCSYDTVFRVILQEAAKLGYRNMPTTLMTDFELAIINAGKDNFGEDIIKCCFFFTCARVYIVMFNQKDCKIYIVLI